MRCVEDCKELEKREERGRHVGMKNSLNILWTWDVLERLHGISDHVKTTWHKGSAILSH